MDIVPTGKIGQQKVNEKRVRQAWEDVKTKATWDGLTNAQRSEYLRQLMKWVLKNEFGDLVDDGD